MARILVGPWKGYICEVIRKNKTLSDAYDVRLPGNKIHTYFVDELYFLDE